MPDRHLQQRVLGIWMDLLGSINLAVSMLLLRLHLRNVPVITVAKYRQWQVQHEILQMTSLARGFFQQAGYRFIQKKHEKDLLFAIMPSGINRIGHFLMLTGVIVIVVACLIESDIAFKIKQWRGDLEVEKRKVSASQFSSKSRLSPANSFSFEGVIAMPEGSQSDFVFVSLDDGFVIQELPFSIELKTFRVKPDEEDKTLIPMSEIVIRDGDLAQPLQAMITLQQAFTYRGYLIQQADFDGAGSILQLTAWPFFDTAQDNIEFKGEVLREYQLKLNDKVYTLNFDSLIPTSTIEGSDEDGAMERQADGANVGFSMDDDTGRLVEFINFIEPVEREGRMFFISATRSSDDEVYRYFSIPADELGTPKKFIKFHALLNQQQRMKKIVKDAATTALKAGRNQKGVSESMQTLMHKILSLYLQGGSQAIDDEIRKSVPEQSQASMTGVYVKLLRSVLQAAYAQLLQQEGKTVSDKLTPQQQHFFEDAMTSLGEIHHYGAAFYLQPTAYQAASVLQVERRPGSRILVYGIILWVVGIIIMFVIMPSRVWLILQQDKGSVRMTLAGSRLYNKKTFGQFFLQLSGAIEQKMLDEIGIAKIRRNLP